MDPAAPTDADAGGEGATPAPAGRVEGAGPSGRAPVGPVGRIEIRLVEGVDGLHACESLAQLVWQVDDREIVPASHLRALQHAGGMVAGAFEDGRLVGFVMGFLARHGRHDPVGLHSHLLAVLPDYRTAGVGRALKWYQRSWSLAAGLPWITWTFDPLQAHNARLNLVHLGAEGHDYVPDFYGTLGGVLFGALPTDRLLIRWDLEAQRVVRLAAGVPPEGGDGEAAPVALARGEGGAPGAARLDLTAPRVRVAIPADFTVLLHRDPAGAAAWREASRRVFLAYVRRGYRARDFRDGHYLLERN